jgi:diguanylate cyclase (GGDEF)-like protein/PAS domain S-box-containing protein
MSSNRDEVPRRASGDDVPEWSQLLGGVPALFVAFDPELRIIECAGGLTGLDGPERAGTIGRPLADVLPGSFEQYEPQCRRALAGDTATVEVTADAGARSYELEFAPWRTAPAASAAGLGAISGAVATVRDVTTARRQGTELFEVSFSSAPTGVALVDLDGRLIRVNDALCALLGRPEHELIGTTTAPLTHPEDRDTTDDVYATLGDGDGPVAFEKRYVQPGGQIVWAATRAATVAGPDGQPSHIVAHVQDITALKQAEHSRAQATRLFETAFADAPIGLALVGLDGGFMRVNGALCDLLRYPESELLSATFQQITHPEDLGADLRQLERLIAGEIERYTQSKRYVTKDGDEVWSNLSVSLVRDDEGHPAHFVSQIEDISDRKRLEIALQHLADHDHLTELWNRRAFEHQLTRQIAQCRRHATPAALLIVDLDDFKAVNDTHGHAAGDALLMCIADALRARLRAEDCVARIGGDEFAVILPQASSEQAAHVARAVTEAISRSCIRIDELDVGVTASVGLICLDKDAPSQHEAVAAADRAMYEDKLTHKHHL